MEKYAVLSAVNRGSFWERLCHLYMKTGDYIDMENLENRHVVYAKVFLSDIRNQYAALLESQLWQDYLSQVTCSVIGQAPLDGSKINVLVCTSDSADSHALCRVRLSGDDVAGMDIYVQSVMLFEKFVTHAHLTGGASQPAGMRVWVYVADVAGSLSVVEKARDDVFMRYGIEIDERRVAVTCVGGTTHMDGVLVALDYISFCRQAKAVVPLHIDSGNSGGGSRIHACTYGIGIDFGYGLRVDLPAFVPSAASGADMSQLDVRQYTGQLLGDMGVRLKSYGLTMNHVRCFVAYLRDFSDYSDVDRLLSMAFPYVPHAIIGAKGADCRRPVMIECVAVKPV